MATPKERNSHGQTFSGWLIAVQDAIKERANDMGPFREGRGWACCAFNTNWHPEAAAYEWLRKQLNAAPKS